MGTVPKLDFEHIKEKVHEAVALANDPEYRASIEVPCLTSEQVFDLIFPKPLSMEEVDELFLMELERREHEE